MPPLTPSTIPLLTLLLPVLAKPEYTPTATPPPGSPSYTTCRDRCVPGGIISGTGCVSFDDFPFNGDWSVFGAATWSCICFQARTGGFSAVTARGCGFGGCGYMLQDLYAEFNQNCTDAEQRYNGTKPTNSSTTIYPTTTPTVPPTYLYTNSSVVSISTGNITDSVGKVTVTKSTICHPEPTISTTSQGGSGTGTGVVTEKPSSSQGGGSKTTGLGISKASTAASSPSGVVTGEGVRAGWNFLGAGFAGLAALIGI